MWLINECWYRDYNYAEYVSWHEIYAAGTDLDMVTELVYVKACADLDDELNTFLDLGDNG